MIDTFLHNGVKDNSRYSSFDTYLARYHDKPNFKSIIWRNYDWLEEIDSSGQARNVILDNVQRTLLCKTPYLGYDAFDCDSYNR